MGTVIGIDVRSDIPAEALDHAFAYLHEVDARFSPFRPDSEIERLARGELSMADASDELLAVTALCHELRLETDGAFDAWGHRPDGSFDPTGVVKGWALDGAAGILRAAGALSFAINGGGDVVVAGRGGAGSAMARRDPPPASARPDGSGPRARRHGGRDIWHLRARRAHR